MKIKFKQIKTGSGAWLFVRLGIVAVSILLSVMIFTEGCTVARIRPNPNTHYKAKVIEVETTAYCNCQECCSWDYNWYGRPVFSTGKNKGKSKRVGYTASGTRAHHGTIAADTSKFPFGTIFEIPDYGMGRVEDRGGAIEGMHIDLWFPRHSDALKWGRKKVKVKVWIAK